MTIRFLLPFHMGTLLVTRLGRLKASRILTQINLRFKTQQPDGSQRPLG